MYELTIKIKSNHLVLMKSFLNDLVDSNLKNLAESLSESEPSVESIFKDNEISFYAKLKETKKINRGDVTICN